MKKHAMLAMVAVATLLPLQAEPKPAERTLVQKVVEKKEVRHSMIGFRDTILFYSFPEEQAILVLRIDNRQDKFPVAGTVHLFDPDTTEEGLGKWINNQHSDGLFPEVPEPILTTKLPEETCSVIEKKVAEAEKKDHMGNLYQDYRVKISVKEYKVDGKFVLKAFKDDAGVFLKVAKG